MDQGLKDRYATIKNELNARTQEPQEPLKAWIDWTDKTLPEQPRFQTPDWREHTYGLKRKTFHIYGHKTNRFNQQ
jgi:hypothetical protein